MPSFVDRIAPQAEWRLMHRLADAAAPSIVRVLHRAWWGPEDETTWGTVIARLKASDAIGGVDAVDVEELARRLWTGVWPKIYAVYLRAGQIVTRQAMRGELRKAAHVQTAFNETNPRAVAWAQRHAARFVTEITRETREGIRRFITDAFVQQVPPVKLVRQLREVIGLTSRQVDTLSRQRDQWVEAGLSESTVLKRMEFASARALRERSWVIARTETMAASNAGQVDAWGVARSEGLLDADLVKEWIVTPDDRLCPECEPLDGEQVALDEAFPGGVYQPPLHPNCRCAVGMNSPR